MTPEQRRQHVIPGRRAVQFNKAKRHIDIILACDPALTPDQIDTLVDRLRGGSNG
jgi:hypothetical protein